jgi:hypothetical protein
MRRVFEHSVTAIGLAALIALVVPSTISPQSTNHQPQAVGAANLVAVTSPMVTVKPLAMATTEGRWKLGGDGSSCYWDPDDGGPDQCSPTPGRWKLGGDGSSCYWDANDSGPNQCEPAASDVPSEARAFSNSLALYRGV